MKQPLIGDTEYKTASIILLQQIRQELIEKIKQESWNLYPSQILDKLIGDNHD